VRGGAFIDIERRRHRLVSGASTLRTRTKPSARRICSAWLSVQPRPAASSPVSSTTPARSGLGRQQGGQVKRKGAKAHAEAL
jgi:hypothetical protein